MDFICIFISLVVHVIAKIISCSWSALNADSNDTKVDQDWQKVMVLAHLNRFSNRDQWERISEIAHDMKSPALGDERSEEYLGMQLVTWLSESIQLQ